MVGTVRLLAWCCIAIKRQWNVQVYHAGRNDSTARPGRAGAAAFCAWTDPRDRCKLASATMIDTVTSNRIYRSTNADAASAISMPAVAAIRKWRPRRATPSNGAAAAMLCRVFYAAHPEILRTRAGWEVVRHKLRAQPGSSMGLFGQLCCGGSLNHQAATSTLA